MRERLHQGAEIATQSDEKGAVQRCCNSVQGIDAPWASLFNDIPVKVEKFRGQFLKEGKKFIHEFVEKLAEWPELRSHARLIGKLTGQKIGVVLRRET